MVWHALLSSLPNILTIFVGIGCFCSLHPLRPHVARHAAAAAAACLALSFASAAIHRLLNPQIAAAYGDFASRVPTLAFFIFVLLACLPLSRLVFELGTWDALFCCTAGYALQNFSHTIWELLCVLPPFESELSQVLSAVLQLLLSAAVFALCYVTVIRRIRTNRLEGTGNWRIIFVLASVIVVNIVLDVTIRSLLDTGAMDTAPYLVLRLSQLLVSALTIVLDYEILYSNRMRADAAVTRQLMENERRQYELSRNTIEAINLRCHDIRHQIRQLSAPASANRAFLDNVSDLISIYDAGVQTSNKALDVILTEKSMLCRSRGIGLTCTTDGSALAFMEEQDVYTLFGNALDNAIEATEAVREPERRLVDVSARTVGRMVIVQVRNFYEGELNFDGNGIPRSSKRGSGLHGYGMKSLRLVAERYGGSLTVSGEDGIFRLHVLLPLPE